jgi:hypothetical protein
MSQVPPRKTEHIQVRVINSLLDVRGQFDRARMEKAARVLDSEIRNRLDKHPGDLPDQGFLSMVLLTAIEKIYEIDRLKEQVRSVTHEVEEWREWASGKMEGRGLSKDSRKE